MLSESRNTVGSCIPKELRDECSDHGSPCCPRPVVATLQRRISLCRGNAISALRPQARARARAQASSRQHTLAHKFHFATDECIWLGRRRRSASHGFAFDAGQKKPKKRRGKKKRQSSMFARARGEAEGGGGFRHQSALGNLAISLVPVAVVVDDAYWRCLRSLQSRRSRRATRCQFRFTFFALFIPVASLSLSPATKRSSAVLRPPLSSAVANS